MADTNPSANMNLPIPAVGIDPGPQWGSDLNSCLTIVDSHDHSSGSGVVITPSGLSINANLPFQNNNAVQMRSVNFTSQSMPINGVADLGCIYVSANDLYYNDELGNQIQITLNGAVAGSPGSISNLVSPASASFNAGTGTFIWRSAANTPANMDGASFIVREQVVSPNGITLSSPTSLAANYTLVLPQSLPASQKFMTLDNSGTISAPWAVDNSTIEVNSNTVQVKALGITAAQLASNSVTTAKILDNNVTLVKTAVPNVVFSSDSGAITLGSSGSYADITQLVATLTVGSSGRGVELFMQSSLSGPGFMIMGTLAVEIAFFRDSTYISSEVIRVANGDILPMSMFSAFDANVAAGTYDYNIKYKAGAAWDLSFTILGAREV